MIINNTIINSYYKRQCCGFDPQTYHRKAVKLVTIASLLGTIGLELVGRITQWFLGWRSTAASLSCTLLDVTIIGTSKFDLDFPLSPSAGVWPSLGPQAGRVRPPLFPVCQAHPDGAADLKQHHCRRVGPRTGPTVAERLRKKKLKLAINSFFYFSSLPLKFPTSKLMLCLQWCSWRRLCGAGGWLTNVIKCAFSQKKNPLLSVVLQGQCWKKNNKRKWQLSESQKVSSPWTTRQKVAVKPF